MKLSIGLAISDVPQRKGAGGVEDGAREYGCEREQVAVDYEAASTIAKSRAWLSVGRRSIRLPQLEEVQQSRACQVQQDAEAAETPAERRLVRGTKCEVQLDEEQQGRGEDGERLGKRRMEGWSLQADGCAMMDVGATSAGREGKGNLEAHLSGFEQWSPVLGCLSCLEWRDGGVTPADEAPTISAKIAPKKGPKNWLDKSRQTPLPHRRADIFREPRGRHWFAQEFRRLQEYSASCRCTRQRKAALGTRHIATRASRVLDTPKIDRFEKSRDGKHGGANTAPRGAS